MTHDDIKKLLENVTANWCLEDVNRNEPDKKFFYYAPSIVRQLLEENEKMKQIWSMWCSVVDMNGEETVMKVMGKLPVCKFNGPLVKAAIKAFETCQNRPYNYNKGTGITTTWTTNEAMAEKIADLESQIESLHMALDFANDKLLDRCIANGGKDDTDHQSNYEVYERRIKDLEKKILKLEVVNPAEFNRGLAHAVELAEQIQNNTTTGTVEWMQGRDDALEEIKNRLAEASENTENSSARKDAE